MEKFKNPSFLSKKSVILDQKSAKILAEISKKLAMSFFFQLKIDKSSGFLKMFQWKKQKKLSNAKGIRALA